MRTSLFSKNETKKLIIKAQGQKGPFALDTGLLEVLNLANLKLQIKRIGLKIDVKNDRK